MRLLLDEHYSKLIAEQLRRRGHDVVSAAELSNLTGANDFELLSWASVERRAIVTENWADFARLLRLWEEEGRTHYGVIFTSRRQLPRSRDSIGLHVQALDSYLKSHPPEKELLDRFLWLPASPAP